MHRRSPLLVSAALVLTAGCSGSSGHGGGAAFSTAPIASGSSGTTPTSTGATGSGSTTTSGTTVTVGSGSTGAPVLAGASRVDITPPIGVPLAGYGGGDRRHKFPNLNPFAYDHFLMPSTGVRDPINARCLYVSDGKKRVMMVALDAIATTHEAVEAAWKKAAAQGFSVPLENTMMCASHSHSGPGALSHLWFWQLTAADLYNDKVFQGFTDGIARAMLEAERNAQPAAIGAKSTQLQGVTRNRRSGSSKVFTSATIDPELLVLRVDSAATGAPIATLWNFACHGISLGEDSHLFSGDIMGGANMEIEGRNGGVSLFINGAEGDITPRYRDNQGIIDGGKIIADAVFAARANAPTKTSLEVDSVSEWVPFGPATLDVTSGRLGNQGAAMLASNGFLVALQKLGVGPALGVKVNIPHGWLEEDFRFQAIKIGKWGFTSMPGEAIHTIGLDLKGKGKSLGFEHVFPCGLANGHMAYITTQSEYWDGGYEALATFWGEHQGDKLVDAATRQMGKIKP